MIDCLSFLLPFLIRAKRATYVGDGVKASPSRTASHDLTYEEGEWSYRDSYFGGTDFIGQEVVWHKGRPIWSMCYYGYILRADLITPTQAGTIIKRALSLPQAQGRLLDNLTFEMDDFKYEITSQGDVTHFKGRETIHAANTLAYALDYFGGLIKD
ncbi:MAG: DUF5680 domain-containing protein [Aestuariivirga sp.]